MSAVCIALAHGSVSDTEDFCDQDGIFLDLWRKTIHHCDVDESLRHQDLLDEDKCHWNEKSWTHNRTHAIRLFKYGCNTKL